MDQNSIMLTIAHLGDANDNGVVDIQDQSLITNNWQKPGTNWANGDLNLDGFVDIQDLTIVTNNWQQMSSFSEMSDQGSATSQIASVPEPLTLPLFGTTGCLAAEKASKTNLEPVGCWDGWRLQSQTFTS